MTMLHTLGSFDFAMGMAIGYLIAVVVVVIFNAYEMFCAAQDDG